METKKVNLYQYLPNEEGIDIYRKMNTTYTTFKFSDHENPFILKGKYNHVNKKEVEASFSSRLFSQFGTETVLTAEEAATQHRGSIRSRLKLDKLMSEEDVIKKILIPAVIDHGLIPRYFPLTSGENPFTRKSGPFLKGYSFHSFTNMFGDTWVAYIDPLSCDIWVSNSSELINWRWVEYEDTKNRGKRIVPWELSKNELQWFNLLTKTREYLSDVLNEFSSFEK